MRTALLPAGPDPFLLAYWLRNYERVWSAEVDHLRVIVAGQRRPDVIEYLRERVAAIPHASVTFVRTRTDHGTMIGRLVNGATDLVMLCEDDAFVRTPGMVAAQFDHIERGEADVVGSPREFCSPAVMAAAHRELGVLPKTTDGQEGSALWPCFLFARKSDLRATDRNYGGHVFPAGAWVPYLRWTPGRDEASDTFVATAWQLRAAGLRVAVEAQHRITSLTLDADVPWFHVGSLSAGYGYTYMDPDPGALTLIPGIAGDSYDWVKRAAWWSRAYDRWDGALPEHHATTVDAFDAFLEDAGLDPGYVAAIRTGFDPLCNWAES